MPSHLLIRCAFQVQDANPKNQFVINPTFRRSLDLSDPTSGTDATALCNDLATALDGWYGASAGQLTVKAYNLQGVKPNYPLATVIKRPGSFYPVTTIGQPAVCLSFYADQNIPRRRGRLYIPAIILKSTGTAFNTGYVDSTTRAKVAALVPLLENLGGSNVDWGVWSRVSAAFHKATNYFVDDQWDIQRSRALKGTSRTTGTTSG